ncbi:YkvA family protein [Parafrankia sp. FMc2]|uniref:YkvA family protein n=1 Tax=Parafrankia sp. FMc2 TaxID=3233196 RepID=UPI0034D3C3A6
MAMVDKDALREFGREVTTFLPDLVIMLRRVVADPRVPQSAKLEAGAALAYLVSPRNRLTNFIPVIGQLDDVAVVAFAFRRLVVGAGEPILREHWRGSDRSFHALIGASSALASPAGMLRRAKVARTLAGAALARVSGGRGETGGQVGGSGPVRVVDGEVIGRSAPDGGFGGR